jgi:hypothetical protein
MTHLFSCESSSLELNFCYPSLNLSCGYFLGKAQTPINSQGCLTHFCPAPWTWETWFYPKRWLLVVSRRWSVSSSASWGRPEFELGFLPVWQAVLPFLHCFLCLMGSIVHPGPSPWLTGRMNPSSGSSCQLPPGGIFSRWSGDAPRWQEWWQISLRNPRQWVPKKCCRNLKQRYGTLKQFSRKQHFIVSAQTQWTRVRRLSPENKEVSPYIPLQAGYRSKKQSLTHIWLHAISLAISFPQCYVTFFMF